MNCDSARQYRYWAFISYSSKDQSWAKWLHKALETYRIPSLFVGQQMPTSELTPKRLHPIFRDRDELPASSNLGMEIERALAASRYLIVIASPNSAISLWVNKEIMTFRELERDDRIFAIIVDGTPNSQDQYECFPPALRQMQPLAADVRLHADGKNDAKLKLLSAMLGIGLDNLKRRDTRRRILQLELTIVIVTTLATVIIGLGWFSYLQRMNALVAELQEAKAIVEPIDLLDFLLFDLRNALESSDRTNIAHEAERHVKDYLKNQNKWQTGELLLASIYRKRILQGDKFLASNHFSDSLTAYRGALQVLEWSVEAYPMVNYDKDKSEVHKKTGKLFLIQEKLDEALDEYRIALNIVRHLSENKSTDKWLRRDLWESYERVGDVLFKARRLDEALTHYRKALGISQQLIVPYETDDGWSQRDVMVIHIRIADTLVVQKQLDLAVREYQAALNIVKHLIEQNQAAIPPVVRFLSKYLGLAEQNTTKQVWQEDLAMVRKRISNVLSIQERSDEPITER